MSAVPPRALLGLTAAVAAAHLLLLRGQPQALQAPGEPARPAPFVTRTVAAPAPEAAAALSLVRTALPLPRAPRPPTSPQRPEEAAAPAAAAPMASLAQAASGPGPVKPVPPSTRAVPTPAAVAIPGSVRLHYRVELRKGAFTLEANSELRWRHDGDSYDARLEVSAPLLPSRTQHSTGRITAEGLAPTRFSDKVRTEEAAHFERDKGKVTFSTNQPDAPLLPGAQDRLSVLLQLSALIAGEPAKFKPGATVTIQTAGTHDSEPWLFTVEGEEKLDLPGGKVPALKLTRHPRKQYDVQVELWLAPGMAYVPVRLRLTQPNGDSVDQQWSSTDRG